eukprot:195659_1
MSDPIPDENTTETQTLPTASNEQLPIKPSQDDDNTTKIATASTAHSPNTSLPNTEKNEEQEEEDEKDNEEYEDEEDEKDNEEYEDGEEEMDDNEWLSADHPLLDRMQIALKKRLERELDRVTTSTNRVSDDLSGLKREREDLGVELYHRQQELASTQMSLEGVNRTFSSVSSLRNESESGLDELRTTNSSLHVHQRVQSKKENELRSELDNLSSSLRHIASYEESMKREILNRRRSAYSSEERMQELESAKLKQDLLMNHLESKIASFKSQMEIYSIQLRIQQEETVSAKEILRESQHEMDAITHEKREYVLKWKSCVIELNKRDDILHKIAAVCAQFEEQIRLKEIEIEQYKRDIDAEEYAIEMKRMEYDKLVSDRESIEAKIEEVIASKQTLEDAIHSLKLQLNSNENTLKHNKLDEAAALRAQQQLETRYSQMMREMHSIEVAIDSFYSEKQSLAHGSDATLAQIKKL